MYFREVMHQERAHRLLQRSLAEGRTAHAYLFEGPEGVGKERTAVALAARLLCAKAQPGNLEPCGTCKSCQLFAAGSHPDYHLVHRGLHKLHPDRTVRNSKGLFLAVDIVRHFLIEPSTHKPIAAERQVFVVRDAERMNESAQNALLKTLEEPPGDVVLILVSASADRLLPTIRSRCARIPYGHLPQSFVTEQLIAQAGLESGPARALAALTDGRLGVALRWHAADVSDVLDGVRTALRIAEDPERFGKQFVALAETLALRLEEAPADEDADGAPATRSKKKTVGTDAQRGAMRVILQIAAMLLRDRLVTAAGASQLRLLGESDETDADRSWEHYGDGIQAIHDAERSLDRNVAPQLTCERLAIQLA